jgi:ribosomal protein L34
MHTKIRNSTLKHRRRTGFRWRKKTKAGRKILNRQRTRAMGKAKFNAKKKKLIQKHKKKHA